MLVDTVYYALILLMAGMPSQIHTCTYHLNQQVLAKCLTLWVMYIIILELCRAHTPRAHCAIAMELFLCAWLKLVEMLYDDLYQSQHYSWLLSCAHEQKTHWACIMHWVGTVDRCGYVSQQKGTICDARGPCPTIWSTLKPVFRRIRLIRCAYESLRCLHLEIWQFLCARQ